MESQRRVCIPYICTLYYINTIWSNRYRNFLLPMVRLNCSIPTFRQPSIFVSLAKLNSILIALCTDNRMQIFRKERKEERKKERKINEMAQRAAILFPIFSYSCFSVFLSLACLRTHTHILCTGVLMILLPLYSSTTSSLLLLLL